MKILTHLILVRNLILTADNGGALTINKNPGGDSQAQALASAIQNNTGIIDISAGQIIDYFPITTSFTVTVQSAAGGGGVTKQINLFNEGYLNTTPTNNGSGADSMSTQYGDGFSGSVYEQYTKIANLGKGIRFTGFSVLVTTRSTGVQTASYFNTMNLEVNIANGKGGLIPYPIDLIEALRNTAQQVGLLTVNKPIFLNALGQIVYQQPVDTIFAWTFFTNASSFRGN